MEILNKNLTNLDRSFARKLSLGVIEKKLTLDYIISKFCKMPKRKLLVILEIGVYQLYYMSKVPESAAVNECVKLSKNNSLGNYSSFVNAVLRKVQSNRIDIDSIEDNAVKYSIPSELIEMWNNQYSAISVMGFLPAFLNEAPTYIVPNLLKTTTKDLQYELNKEGIISTEEAKLLKIENKENIFITDAFKKGLFFVEDLSSYKAVAALNPLPGETVLDLCAAPGGKSFSSAILMENKGAIYSFDKYESRLNLIKSNAERLCINVNIYKKDATICYDDIPKADKIICDVPCSGLGVIRRKPEIKYRKLEEIETLPDIQFKILNNSLNYLKDKGTILYSTCTLNKNENEYVVDKFINENTGLSCITSKTIFPKRDGEDGFYYALIKK